MRCRPVIRRYSIRSEIRREFGYLFFATTRIGAIVSRPSSGTLPFRTLAGTPSAALVAFIVGLL
jgi:hypothetical protein